MIFNLPSFRKNSGKILYLREEDMPRTLKDKLRAALSMSEKSWSLATGALATLCLVLVLTVGLRPVQQIISPLTETTLVKELLRGFRANANGAEYASSVKLPSGQTIFMPDLQGLFTKDMQYKEYSLKNAREFMAILPDNEQRVKKEMSLLKYLKKQNASAADMIFASEAVVTKPARAYAMEYLWQLRQSGKLTEFNINPLDERRVKWARERNIDPRMLAIATDLYGPTLQLLKAEPTLFFEAAEEKAQDTDPGKYLPSPAVIARLQMSETGWHFSDVVDELKDNGISWDFPKNGNENRAFVNIGGVSAWDALNLDASWFPSGHNDLTWIAKQLENSTGLPYSATVKDLPGSARGSGDGSGGAIGPQFMPINARLFMSWYFKANEKMGNPLPPVNLFNPWTGTMLSYLYLTSEFYHRQANVDDVITDVVRPGYAILEDGQKGLAYTREDPRIKALLKWNPLRWEAETAVQAGEEYNDMWRTGNLQAAATEKIIY